MRRRAAVVLAATCGLATACGSSSPLGSLQGQSPGAILSLAESAVTTARSSFHFADETKAGGRTVTLIGDDTAAGSEETLSGAEPNLEVRQTADGVIYLRGAEAALEGGLGLSAAAASAHVGQWISLEPHDAPYASVARALDPHSELDPYLPHGTLELESGPPIDGHRVVAVVGAAPAADNGGKGGTATLFVPTQPPYTPVGASLSFGKGSDRGIESALFGRWGERITETAPTPSLSYSSLAPPPPAHG